MIDQYIQNYGNRLYGLCHTLCTNTFDADDLYQDTWLKVVKSIAQYDPAHSFEPWLTKICVNTYRNTLRRLVRSPIFNGFSTPEEKTAVLENVSATESPDYSDLHHAIDGLPEKLRITLIFVCSDFGEGTIRNIISGGFSRRNVFIAKYVSCIVASFGLAIIGLIY